MKKTVKLLILCGCFSGFLQTTTAQEPWTENQTAVDPEDGIHVLILHDMEGLAGQDDPRTFMFGTEQYPQGQNLLVADVNAVIRGLFAGGATQISVVDGHGSTNPDPDILAEKLNPRAKQVFRDHPFDGYIDLAVAGAYDAVAVVGMHAKTGSHGFASHTYTIGSELVVNGSTITETELVALSYGEVGIPVIFASGDDRLANDLQTLPWVQFVITKKATSASTAELRLVDEVHREMEEKASIAVGSLERMRSIKANAPVFATVNAVPPSNLSVLEGIPGVNYHDGGVSFIAGDFHEAYRGMVPILGVLSKSWTGIVLGPMMGDSTAEDHMQAGKMALVKAWLDAESGRLPEPTQGQVQDKRRYHGAR